MIKIMILSLTTVLAGVSGGCAPGPVRARGTVEVLASSPGEQPRPPEGRTVVLTFWRHPGVNNRPARIVPQRAILAGREKEEIEFGLQLYPIVWTPALGTQHLAPVPGVAAFAEGYWPVVAYDVSTKGPRLPLCCGPPGRHIREFRPILLPHSVAHPTLKDGQTKPDLHLLLQCRKQLDKALLASPDLTDEDREMVENSIDGLAHVLNAGEHGPRRE